MFCQQNVLSAYIDVSSLTKEDAHNDLSNPDNNGLLLLDPNSLLNIANIYEGSILMERPTYKNDPLCSIKDGSVVYTFLLNSKKNLQSISRFYLYFQKKSKIHMNNIISLKVFHQNKNKDKDILCETISREFFAVWFRTFKQDMESDDIIYLPIFLNRHNLSYYTCVENFTLKIEVSFEIDSSNLYSQKDYSESVYLSYRTTFISKSENIVKKIEENNMYYLYDAIVDMEENNKWISMDSNLDFSTDIRLNEPFNRLSDLFVVLRKKNEAVEEKDKEIVQKLSVFYEETLVFELPANMAESLLSPLNYPQIRYSKKIVFAKEIISVYYLPFSTQQTLYKGYITRPFVNTSKIGNMHLHIETDKSKVSNKDLYEICICYMSPLKLVL